MSLKHAVSCTQRGFCGAQKVAFHLSKMQDYLVADGKIKALVDGQVEAAYAGCLQQHYVGVMLQPDCEQRHPDTSLCKKQILRCWIHPPQLSAKLQTFAVLYAVPKANSTWGMSGRYCKTGVPFILPCTHFWDALLCPARLRKNRRADGHLIFAGLNWRTHTARTA